MKKIVLKILAVIGATGTWLGSGFGLLWLMGKILGGKISDEYFGEHPILGWFWLIGGMFTIVLAPLWLLWDIVWNFEDKIEKKIDAMRDDSKHIDVVEKDEFEN